MAIGDRLPMKAAKNRRLGRPHSCHKKTKPRGAPTTLEGLLTIPLRDVRTADTRSSFKNSQSGTPKRPVSTRLPRPVAGPPLGFPDSLLLPLSTAREAAPRLTVRAECQWLDGRPDLWRPAAARAFVASVWRGGPIAA